ncbi:tandem C2 domains nuclear protein [Brienomyrus brachyistius]|uniref:tandem C2 domains nuclear protein n=1 Tax=Brienomyrus brachyistius TaxID=42636 RepID=UPI0020B345B4|nr:tandem C2 domains nuclear protein [Brienomyrus brachyistius]XP_048831669.1 tandem C2 domains nuclear protein [Brienomyrus brachyistius]
MAMECLKNCFKTFPHKIKDTGSQARSSSALKTDPRRLPSENVIRDSGDYFLSKLPADGRDVPFVLPAFKSSYVQPSGNQYPVYGDDLHYSTRRAYADRKAELSRTNHIVYNPCYSLNQSTLADLPGSSRHSISKNNVMGTYGSVCDLKSEKAAISNSVLDLTHLPNHVQCYDSVSSVRSSVSSVRDSPGSSRSLESITLSGDEREKGRLSIRLSYQEAREQVWITLLQCKDLYFPVVFGEQQKIGIKGIITTAKPVQFKSSIKEATPDLEIMETFVFSLSLKQLHGVGLVFRLQTYLPQKCTLGECAVSLRQLGPSETLHWLDIHAPSKASICHAELQISTCFQAVCGRIQLQVLGARNVPSSSAPFSQSFFVKAEMYSLGKLITKKKTRALKSPGGQVQWSETFLFPLTTQEQGVCFSAKLYSRSSVRRKQFLGQVNLGFENSTSDAVEQWRDTIAHPEKVVSVWHKLSREDGCISKQ